jgi:hypothetical protein
VGSRTGGRPHSPNNFFEDCNFGPCGGPLIHLEPELPDGADPRKGAIRTAGQNDAKAYEPAPVIKNIRIEHNTIVTHSSSLLRANGVDGLIFAGNKIIQSKAYPMRDNGPGYRAGANRLECADRRHRRCI